jgi:hypothetical protein
VPPQGAPRDGRPSPDGPRPLCGHMKGSHSYLPGRPTRVGHTEPLQAALMAGEFAVHLRNGACTAWRRFATGWTAPDGALQIIALSPGRTASSSPKRREQPRCCRPPSISCRSPIGLTRSQPGHPVARRSWISSAGRVRFARRDGGGPVGPGDLRVMPIGCRDPTATRSMPPELLISVVAEIRDRTNSSISST